MKIYLSSKGVRPDRDNSGIINKILEGAKPKSRIVFPDGLFPLYAPIQANQPLYFEGSDDTELEIRHDESAAVIINAIGTISKIERVNLRNVRVNGFAIRSRVLMNDCIIEGIPDYTKGNGIDVYGNVNSGAEASFCSFRDVVIQSVYHGIYITGPDANESGFNHVDVRDCSGVGFYDNSFLGNRFYNCMGHYNKGGNFRAEDPNNMASFVGCYSERGAAEPDYIGGHATWFGGRPSNGFTFAQEGSAYLSGKIVMKGVDFHSYKCEQNG